MIDNINHPPHYTAFGAEVIEITEHLNFCRGNAIKYLARAGLKGDADDELKDLKKARWYIEREIGRLEKTAMALCSHCGRTDANASATNPFTCGYGGCPLGGDL